MLGKQELPVSMYSAVQDQKVHFRLLHKKDSVPVEQRIVRKSDGKEVPKEERRKAFPLSRSELVILQPAELENLEPDESREIHICRFVPARVLSDQWFDRPYFLGPDKNSADYFALAAIIDHENLIGIARWVMRKKRYVGALTTTNGYLMVTTLRRADQVLSISNTDLPEARKPAEREIKLAKQLVDSIEGDFDPQAWKNEYQTRVHELIDAKAHGRKVKRAPVKRKRASGGLAEQLQRSLAAA
jgi:DNA end-binding protein Ku